MKRTAEDKAKRVNEPAWPLIACAVVCVIIVRLWSVGEGLALWFSKEVSEAETVSESIESENEPGGGNRRSGSLSDNDYLYADDDEGSVVTMYLTVRRGNSSEGTDHTWAEVNAHPAYYYDEKGISRYKVEGLLQVGDESGPLESAFGYDEIVPNATVQIRGQSSSRNPQKSYKIEIKRNRGDWRGMTTIALNKHVNDNLRYRNKLGFDLLKDIPQLPSLRTQFVHLYVKDETTGASEAEYEDYGLFTQVEVWNKKSLRAHGFDRNGQLYKVTNSEFYRYEDEIRLGDDPAFDLEAFESRMEIKGDTDHSKLIAMLEDVNNEELPIEDVLDAHFDLTNLTYWMAFQILIGNLDTQNGNFYLYSPLASDTFYILPWDLDGGFGTDDLRIVGWQKAESPWNRGVSNYWGNAFFRRCLQSETFCDALEKAITDLHAYMNEDRIKQMTDVYRKVTEEYAFTAPDMEYNLLSYSKDAYDRISDRLPSMVDFYYDQYKESLEAPMPFFIGTPRLENGRMTLHWAESYDLQGGTLTYDAKIASDPEMKDVKASYEGTELSLDLETLPEGQYFARVFVKDEDGNEQSAFDNYHYEDEEGWHQYSGTRVFYVNADGTVSTQ